ncbi:MAG: ABC transporter ATP-binding protein [Rubrivivax sp.]|jgi:simple sugar transport system ATP-binding protein|nr:ABC transporter ATP-binding protein [Rubrivivax sp.]
MSVSEPLLRMENIVKTFPGVTANRGINLEVRRGEIHCLLGENGAGKSVLMGQLYGLLHPDSGHIYYQGQPLRLRSPNDAIRHRIGMVHQHFMLVPTLSVAENMILGQHRPWKVLRKMSSVSERIRTLGREFGLEVNPEALISELSVGEQQRVEILKALYHGVDLLILDEPTAVLTPQETTQLLTLLRSLADKGLTIIFITHKLEEVMMVSDRVTVLRDGKEVATLNTIETNPRELARLMVGREVLMEFARHPVQPGEVVLSVRHLVVNNERGLPAVKDVSFEVREREIVGIAGVSGNGQSELALALAGLAPITGGEIRLGGQMTHNLSPRRLSQLGLTHIPEDRHRMGVILPFSVAENFIMHEYDCAPYARRGFLAFRRIEHHAWELVKKFAIRAADVADEIGHLSGGNQQKVVVARELHRDPRLLLVNQPTRGIDVGATEFVLQQILLHKESGAAVLLISTELEELLALSDRILVMYEGQLMGEVPARRELVEEIGLLMAGKKVEHA